MKESNKNDEELVIVMNPEDLTDNNLAKISEYSGFFKKLRKAINEHNKYTKRFRRDFADLLVEGNIQENRNMNRRIYKLEAKLDKK